MVNLVAESPIPNQETLFRGECGAVVLCAETCESRGIVTLFAEPQVFQSKVKRQGMERSHAIRGISYLLEHSRPLDGMGRDYSVADSGFG